MNRFRPQHLAIMTLLMFAVSLLTATQLSAANKPWIGVYMQDVTPDIAEAFDLGVKKGVVVNDIADDSPAQKAGIKQRDVIVAWNGQSISDSDVLQELVAASKVGDEAKLTVNRGGKDMTLTVTVGERKEPQNFGGDGTAHRKAIQEYMEAFKTTGIGVSLQTLTEQLGDYFGIKDGEGALITEVMKDTPAEKAGLKAGDVIVKVDGEKVETPSDVSSLVQKKDKGDKVDLTVMRDKDEKSFSIEVDEINSFGALDPSSMPGTMMLKNLPNGQNWMYQFNPKSDDEMQQKMDEMQQKLDEMQRKLERMESKMK